MNTKSPFKLLDHYTRADQAIFFGRESEVDRLYDLVNQSRLILVYGASGVGKTSLVKCGLSNKFCDTDWFEVYVRRRSNINRSLKRAIKRSALNPVDADASLEDAVDSLFLDYLKPIYFVFDQFEEVFILGTGSERKRFYKYISRLLTQGERRQLPLRIIIIMREEYLARMNDFERYLPRLFENRLRVEPMNNSSVREVIKGSCRQFGIRVQKPVHTTKHILARLTDHRRGVQLSYLQLYLDKLFHEYRAGRPDAGSVIFSTDLVERVGSIGDILVEFMEEQQRFIQQELEIRYGVTDPEVVANIMDQFATPEGTRRTLTRAEIKGEGISEAALAYCTNALVDSRLLRTDEGTFELSHDKLAEKIDENRDIQTRDLIRIQQDLIRPKLALFKERKALLSEDEIYYIRPYLKHLQGRTEFMELFQLSEQERNKEKHHLQELYRETEKGRQQVEVINKVLYSNIWLARRDYNVALQFALQAWRMSNGDLTPSLEVKQALIAAYYAADEQGALNYERQIEVGSIIRYIKVSPDEQLLFVATAANDALLYTLSGRLIEKLPFEDISVATFSPDSRLLLVATSEGELYRIDRQGQVVARQKLEHQAVRQIVFLLLGRSYLVGANNFLGQFSYDGSLQYSFPLPEDYKAKDDIKQLVVAHDGTFFVAITVFGHHALCYSLQEGRAYRPLIGHSDKLTAVDISPDSSRMATVSTDKQLIIWSREGTMLHQVVAHDQAIISVQFSPDGSQVLTASKDNTAKVWDISCRIVQILRGHQDDIAKAIFTPGGKNILTISNDHTARLWYPNGRTRLMYGHQGRISDAHALQHYGEVITASSDHSLRFWNAASTNLIKLQVNSDEGINAVTFSPDGQLIATAGGDGRVVLWSLEGKALQEFTSEHPQAIDCVLFHPTAQHLYTLGRDKMLRAWDMDGTPLFSIGSKKMMINKCMLAPDGQYLFTLDTAQRINIWDSQGIQITSFPTHHSKVYRFDTCYRHQLLVTACKDNTAAIWDFQGHLIAKLEGHEDNVHSAYFHPTEDLVITSSADRTARIWDLKGNCLQDFGPHPRSVSRAFFIPGSSQVLTQSMGYDIRLWDEQGKLQQVLDGHSGHVNQIVFSPDGQYILSASNDQSVILWTKRGDIIKRFYEHSAPVNSVCFSPDSRRFISVDVSGSAICRLTPEGVLNAVSF